MCSWLHSPEPLFRWCHEVWCIGVVRGHRKQHPSNFLFFCSTACLHGRYPSQHSWGLGRKCHWHTTQVPDIRSDITEDANGIMSLFWEVQMMLTFPKRNKSNELHVDDFWGWGRGKKGWGEQERRDGLGYLSLFRTSSSSLQSNSWKKVVLTWFCTLCLWSVCVHACKCSKKLNDTLCFFCCQLNLCFVVWVCQSKYSSKLFKRWSEIF